MPPANQKVPSSGGKKTFSSRSRSIGSPISAAGSSAMMKGYVGNCAGSSGMTSPRLMPRPPAMPVRKKAGGPPIGPLKPPNTKNDGSPSRLV
jgi:hypothetical protein